MNYNKKHIDIQIGLINSFLYEMPTEILDVSYDYTDKKITVQIVSCEEANLNAEITDRILKNLADFQVSFKMIYISREKYNLNKENWRPIDYEWLDHLLYSKTEKI